MKSPERETYFTRIRPAVGARRLTTGVVEGLAALFSLAEPGQRHPVSRRMTATQALRGDMVRIGGDMRRVIERERMRRGGPEEIE